MNTYLTLVGIATMAIAMVISSITLAMPFLPANAFSSNPPPPQSCFPPGIDHSHTGQNPNCYGGRIPSCNSNGNTEGSSGCRNVGH